MNVNENNAFLPSFTEIFDVLMHDIQQSINKHKMYRINYGHHITLFNKLSTTNRQQKA